jgi:hypothetical protein
MPRTPASTPAMSTTLDSIQITPRTPRGMRLKHEDAVEVEMSLLDEDDRRRADAGFADGNGHLEAKHKAPLSSEDKRAMALLCVLCRWLPSSPLRHTTKLLPFRTRVVSLRSHPGCSSMCQHPLRC